MFDNEVNIRTKNDINYNIKLNDEQKEAKRQILESSISFLHGQPGSGKTILACNIALDLVFKKEKEKIIVTRPTVGTEDNGFLPGTFQEKLEPWLVPIRDNLRKVYNKSDKLDQMERDEQIEIVSLQHFRGRTFSDAVCIIDEYQNLTKQQLKMAIGRLGKNSIMIFCGDKTQIDLRNNNDSGIHDVAKLINCKYVSIIELKENHRHESITEILRLLE